MPNNLDLNAILKQAQILQQQFDDAKERLKQQTASATVGGGAVTATVDGSKSVVAIKIAPELLRDGDVNAIEDLVVSAVNAANAEIDKKINSNLAAFAGNALGGLAMNGDINDLVGKFLGSGK